MANVNQIAKVLGAALEADNRTHQHRMRINSETSSNTYIVAQNKNNLDWECGCKGWIFHRKCKHLRTMGPALQLLGGQVHLKGETVQTANPDDLGLPADSKTSKPTAKAVPKKAKSVADDFDALFAPPTTSKKVVVEAPKDAKESKKRGSGARIGEFDVYANGDGQLTVEIGGILYNLKQA